MPELITIIFNCYQMDYSVMNDPSRLGEGRKCSDAYEDFIDYLNDHHISYYEQNVTIDEMHAEQDRLESLGVKEYAV